MPVMSQDFGRALKEYAQEGLRELGLELSPEAWERLELYFSLLREFGAPLGLTALKDPKDFAVKHLLDSLTVQPFLPEGPLLDLGTGAGLPGMVLKIVDPAREVWLVDEKGRQIQATSHDGARPLSLSEIRRVERVGTCLACHRRMVDRDFWEKVVQEHGRAPDDATHHRILERLLR